MEKALNEVFNLLSGSKEISHIVFMIAKNNNIAPKDLIEELNNRLS